MDIQGATMEDNTSRRNRRASPITSSNTGSFDSEMCLRSSTRNSFVFHAKYNQDSTDGSHLDRYGVDAALRTSTSAPMYMAVSQSGKRWKSGETIRIFFLEGNDELHRKVKSYAEEWLKYANLKFDFLQVVESTDIRISFRQGEGSWSHVGTTAREFASPEATMNLDFSNSESEAEIKGAVLHEFGHVLGFEHEHSSPVADVVWDESVVYQRHEEEGWSREMVDSNIFLKCCRGETKCCRGETKCSRFDRKSIMLYPIPVEWTKNRFHSEQNYKLSATDKSYATKWYPKEEGNNFVLRVWRKLRWSARFGIQY